MISWSCIDYRGPDAAVEFVKRIEDDCVKLTKIMSRTNKPHNLSPNEEKEFEAAGFVMYAQRLW